MEDREWDGHKEMFGIGALLEASCSRCSVLYCIRQKRRWLCGFTFAAQRTSMYDLTFCIHVLRTHSMLWCEHR